jgi:histidine triad (HIT) family protein
LQEVSAFEMPDPQRHISAFEQANPQAVGSPRPSYDPANAFLSILRDEAQSHIVLDTEHALGFLDAAPYCPGHCLLVPKAVGYASMLDLPQQAAEQVLREVPRLARAVAKATGCDGVNVWQNNGPAARQEVFHLSVHIFPRSHGDDMAAMMAKRQVRLTTLSPLSLIFSYTSEKSVCGAAGITAAVGRDRRPNTRGAGDGRRTASGR